uniref:Secreted protein n=1 Tax=Rhipicephalus microplus TaxID=6941 RepID=A0A6G5A127_RHIMP
MHSLLYVLALIISVKQRVLFKSKRIQTNERSYDLSMIDLCILQERCLVTARKQCRFWKLMRNNFATRWANVTEP